MRRLLLTPVVLAGAAWAADARAAPSVWVIDDGEKIRRDATSTSFERGEQNPVWRPHEPVRAFAMRGETIALQVVVEADDAPLGAVSVDLSPFAGPGGATWSEADVERFVEYFVPVRRASGGRTQGESLGWETGAAPDPRAWVGAIPDALVPVEIAAAWTPYPMRIAPRTNGIVWIDLHAPLDGPAGAYRGTLEVREGPRGLASIPVELEIVGAELPEPPAAAVLFYDPEEIARRVGPGAEVRLWKLLHAHRIAPLHDVRAPDDVRRQRAALDGTLYTPSAGYLGPGRGQGDALLSLGAYGGLGDADPRVLETLADALVVEGVPGSTEVFLYADDEECASPRAAAWRAAVDGSSDPSVRRVRVGWTCSDDPSGQPVDLPMLEAADYDVGGARAARARGKEVWVYNGVMPHTGTFLLDADATSPRVNGWIGEMFGIPHWLYWESTYWYGRHGKTPVDPFAEAESFHNDRGDWAEGDGVLLYPGRQRDAFGEHSLGFDGVLPSIRLKNWRRGLEDAGYLRLARAADRRRAEEVARALVPAAFHEVAMGSAPAWSARGQAFFDARRELLDIVLRSRSGRSADPPPSQPRTHDPSPLRAGWTATAGGACGVGVLAVAAAIVRRRRPRRPRVQA